MPNHLPISEGRKIEIMAFGMELVRSKTKTASLSIRTRVTDSFSADDSRYTAHTPSFCMYTLYKHKVSVKAKYQK